MAGRLWIERQPSRSLSDDRSPNNGTEAVIMSTDALIVVLLLLVAATIAMAAIIGHGAQSILSRNAFLLSLAAAAKQSTRFSTAAARPRYGLAFCPRSNKFPCIAGRNFMIFGIPVQNWMLIALAVVVVGIAISWWSSR
jgi:hypothetical protein